MKNGSVKAGRGEREFELVGGHPALDLVNTLDWRFRESGAEELIENYADVVSFVEQAGMLGASDARRLIRTAPESRAEKVVVAVRELREAAADALYAVVEGRSPATTVVRRLEAWFAEAGTQQQLYWDGAKMAWKVTPSAGIELPLWLLSLSVAQFMTSHQLPLLRACGAEECRWLFVDTSKNHTRRWCDMKICGNRVKARRFKAQQRG